MNKKIKKSKLENRVWSDQIRETEKIFAHSQRSYNEAPVEMLNPKIKQWVKVVKPSRASLTYERYE